VIGSVVSVVIVSVVMELVGNPEVVYEFDVVRTADEVVSSSEVVVVVVVAVVNEEVDSDKVVVSAGARSHMLAEKVPAKRIVIMMSLFIYFLPL